VQPAAQKAVFLRPGWSPRRIAAELKSAGVIRSSQVFILWHYFHRTHTLKAGEYAFVNPANTRDVFERIVHGDFLVHVVVVPEGYNIFEVATAVQAAGLGKAEDFLNVARTQASLVSDLAPQAQSLEGFLFPDTYQFSRLQSMEEIAGIMVHRFRREAESLGLSGDIQRIVTMASIVEKETGAGGERALVASVYYNRLEKKMALDADPCVIYAHLLNGTYRGALHHDDMRIASPYNTYRYPDLPPGPIANPGRAALEAAQHPAQSNFLFFVADGSGHHRFARTLSEHNKNVNAYRRTIAAKREALKLVSARADATNGK
jgi:UPF0755 protein